MRLNDPYEIEYLMRERDVPTRSRMLGERHAPAQLPWPSDATDPNG